MLADGADAVIQEAMENPTIFFDDFVISNHDTSIFDGHFLIRTLFNLIYYRLDHFTLLNPFLIFYRRGI